MKTPLHSALAVDVGPPVGSPFGKTPAPPLPVCVHHQTSGWIGCLILFGVLSSLSGCRSDRPVLTSEDRIAASVAEKLESWRARRRKECRDRALTEAQRQADSLVLDYAYAQRMMLDRPARPVRPVEPPLLRPNDTLRLAPFLGDTL